MEDTTFQWWNEVITMRCAIEKCKLADWQAGRDRDPASWLISFTWSSLCICNRGICYMNRAGMVIFTMFVHRVNPEAILISPGFLIQGIYLFSIPDIITLWSK